MRVAKLHTYRARDTVEVLEALLKNARKGAISGLVVAWKSSDGRFDTVTTGDYARDYIQALGATGKLFCKINEQHEKTASTA